MSNIIDASIAKKFDFIVKQNQTFNPEITVLDNSNNPFNMNDATVKMSIRDDKCGCDVGCDENFDLVYKQDFIPTITGTDFNVLEFFDTVKLSVGIYKYDLLAEYQNGLKMYLLTGSFRVKKSYTKI